MGKGQGILMMMTVVFIAKEDEVEEAIGGVQITEVWMRVSTHSSHLKVLFAYLVPILVTEKVVNQRMVVQAATQRKRLITKMLLDDFEESSMCSMQLHSTTMSNDNAENSDLVELTSMEPVRVPDGDEDTEDEEDEEYPNADSSQEFTVKKEYTEYGGDLPVHVRNLMQEIVNDELGGCRADVLSASTAVETDQPSTSQATPTAGPAPERERIPRKLSKTMDALLGHANVIYAKGNTQEALAVLLEVIRQEPRNAASYRQVSDIYQELGDAQKSLQYGLLAAHLDTRTPAEDWAHWGDESKKLELIEEAAACYGRAIRLNVTNWKYYENRIEMLDMLGLRPLAMRTRLQAAQMIDPSQAGVDFEWFHELIKTVAQYYIAINDEDRAILALEAFVLRSKEFGRSAENQHETLIGMWMAKNKFLEAAKSIFALCDGIFATRKSDGEPAFTITLSHGTYSVEPFPPDNDVQFYVEPTFPTITLCRLIVCFIGLGKRELAKPLKAILLNRDLLAHEDEPHVLEIARAYYNCDAFKTTKLFLETLQEWNNYCDNPEMWFIYGNTAAALKDITTAMESFEKVLQLNPGHVDARINLSGLQQKIGQSDRALETLQDYDLDTCTHLPDERLLIRQADVLFDSQKTEQFIRCCRMLLTPHFYEVHRNQDTIGKRRSTKTGFYMSNTLRVAAINAITNTNWEKFVRRLGSAATSERRSVDELEPALLHDYCLKLIECLLAKNRYQDMLIVCCYAFLQPRITRSEKSSTFQNLLYFCAIKAHCWPVAFEYVRWYHTLTNTAHQLTLPNCREVLYKRIFNAMNYVFVHSQNVSYHRYVMRSLSKSPGNHALQTISGNNSLITGSYRHALGEYLRVWNENKKNPMICLLLALTFTHMACKKDISSRHMIAVRVLSEPPPRVFYTDDEGNEDERPSEMYDVRRFAAHNLALIYRASGMFVLALLEDTIAIKPHELGKELGAVLRRRINQRLSNKVVPDLGLCICVYDLLEVGVTYILPGEGSGHTRVKFRLVVFRPHVDEVIEARVVSSTSQGLTLSLEFFEDITIPAERLPEPHVFEQSEQSVKIWYWEYPSEDGEPPAKLYMDPGKTVRFRVVENIFRDVKPNLTQEEAQKEKSYEIIGTMAETGLGCVAWWSTTDDAADEADDMDEE
ncbi:General transcription factor 3C polypeptide 3 [Trichostrongylus colubriformis]|uniref:General transcription factor 3C polypeptide 3 n=1 Tax=Trichostrongylus colubriformis TaxID=6319 RepID=A0AAN8FBH3_TRICO